MTSVQERLQLKREPLDKWSVREQLCLASAVCRSGDQNWMSVSRALKPFGEPNRPSDWFHQKNCAAQYGMLLGNVETPKRKNKKSNVDPGIETPAESILKRLVAERQAELKRLLAEEKAEYLKLQQDMMLLQSGKVPEEQLDRWCQQIEEEENRKEQETIVHMQLLKERELRKQEIEKAWRPAKAVAGQKRKSDIMDNFMDQDHLEEVVQHHQAYPQTPEPAKPALSPLLTSLLKSPSQAQNTPILHTAITNRPMPNTNTNPMIASLLNSSTGVTVSPGLQQLVSSAIGQDTPSLIQQHHQQQVQQFQQIQTQHQISNDILDDPNLPNIKLDDLANSILVQDGPLPEIKKEEVDDIISEIIQADPERHLQLDGNGDINLELDDFDDDEVLEGIHQQQQQQEEQQQQQLQQQQLQQQQLQQQQLQQQQLQQQQLQQQQLQQQQQELQKQQLQQLQQVKEEPKVEKKQEKIVPPVSAPVIDPFEFQEDPVIHLETTLKTSIIKQEHKQYVPQYQLQTSQVEMTKSPVKEVPDYMQPNKTQNVQIKEEIQEEVDSVPEKPAPEQKEPVPDIPHLNPPKIEKSPLPGSVEIVEVVVTDEEEELDKDTGKSDDSEDAKPHRVEIEDKTKSEESSPPESKESSLSSGRILTIRLSSYSSKSVSIKQDTASIATFEESSEASDFAAEVKKENGSTTTEGQESGDGKTEFGEELFDDMEVKFDKSAKKRDYSRTKKKDEKGFDILLAIEKAHLEESELTEETFSDATTDTDKKDSKLLKIKTELDRSSSPWTEEEDGAKGSVKRRYSTPVTPTDSIPNSPASSTAFLDEDREHRNWKKSVMLVYNRLATHKYASLFLKPITDDHAPGYSNTVYRPMDLLTIKRNVENGTIRTTLEFKRDTMLMFTNAIMYNRTNSLVYTMALEMQQECTEPIEILMMAENHKDISLRRETRTSELGTKRKRTLTDEILIKTTVKKRKDD